MSKLKTNADTPRTDALVKQSETDLLAITSYKKAVELSRALERELNAAKLALLRISECKDAPDIDPVGDVEFGLHCGVEDRSCTDRYDGANFGYAQGVERTLEWSSNEAKHALEAAKAEIERLKAK